MLHCGGIVSLLEKCLNAVKSLNSVRVQTRKQVSVLEARALLLAIDNLGDQCVGPQVLFVCLKQICKCLFAFTFSQAETHLNTILSFPLKKYIHTLECFTCKMCTYWI